MCIMPVYGLTNKFLLFFLIFSELLVMYILQSAGNHPSQPTNQNTTGEESDDEFEELPAGWEERIVSDIHMKTNSSSSESQEI